MHTRGCEGTPPDVLNPKSRLCDPLPLFPRFPVFPLEERPNDSCEIRAAYFGARNIYIHICISCTMSSKTLMVRKPIYEALHREKRPGESFSQLMERLLSRPRGVQSCYGAWRRNR
jgi:hypothetical protein